METLGLSFLWGDLFTFQEVTLKHFQEGSLRNRRKEQLPLSFVHEHREWMFLCPLPTGVPVTQGKQFFTSGSHYVTLGTLGNDATMLF